MKRLLSTSHARQRPRKRRKTQDSDQFDAIDPSSRAEAKAPTRSWVSPVRETLYRIPLFNQSSRRVRLPYFENSVVRSGTAGAITNYFFTANGLFDPNVTGTGHQPAGFDEMIKYYEQYTVMRSVISVTFLNNGLNAFRGAVALTPDTTNAVVGDNVENGQIKYDLVDSAAYATGAGNGIRYCTIDLDCDCGRYFGRRTDREMLNDTSLQGGAGSNPSEQVYFDIQTWGFGGLTDNTTALVDVLIWYDAIFWEPRKIAGE